MDELGEEARARLLLRVNELNLSVRATNVLTHAGIEFVGDLVGMARPALFRFQNCGRTTVDEIVRKCDDLGIPLGTELIDWDPDAAAKTRARADEELMRRIGGARSATYVGEAGCLEDELRGLVRHFSGDRNTEMILKLFGWTGLGKRTLESVGEEYDLSRERIRQVAARFHKKIVHCRIEAPWLQRAVQAVGKMCPSPALVIAEALREMGITKADFEPSGLATACDELGIQFGVKSLLVGKTRVYFHSECTNIPRELFQICRSQTSSRGCANFDSICDELGIQDGLRDRYRDIIALAHRTQWLDKQRLWLFSGGISRNRLANLVSKVLFISPSIGLHELRRAVGRSRRLEVVPPSDILATFVQATGLASVQNGLVTAEQTFEDAIEPGSVEEKMIAIFEEHGPVLGWDRLQELCIAAGVNPTSATIYMSISPVISRLVRGVYALVGAKVEPGMVEEELAKLSDTGQGVGLGWSKRGTLWCALHLTRNVLISGSASLPTFVAAMAADRDWQVKCGGKILDIRLKCRNHFIWSLAKPLVYAGAEPGDVCVLEFDLKADSVEISVGSEELEDAWQNGHIDLLSKAENGSTNVAISAGLIAAEDS